MKVIVLILTLLVSNSLFAIQKQSQTLQTEYQSKQTSESFVLSTVYNIPEHTYNYLSDIFNSFYERAKFNTSITNSTFDTGKYHEIVSLPFIAENKYGLHFEVFGNISDSKTSYLSNLPKNVTIFDYYTDSGTFDLEHSNMTLGAGFGFNASKTTKIKLIVSDGDLPGYGSSNALVGFETIF